MSSPLVRIPLSLVAAAAFHVSMSPPTGPGSLVPSHAADADKLVNRRSICSTACFITTVFTKGVYWGSVFADTFILLAPYLPTTPTSIPSISLGTLLSWTSRATTWLRTLATQPSFLNPFPDLLHHPRLPLLALAGTTLVLSGALLRATAFRALGQFYACTNTGPGPCKPARDSPSRRGHAHALITSGPYAYVRHPGYAGLMLCTAGLVVLHVEALHGYLGSSNGRPSWGVVDEIVGMGVGGASVGMRTVAFMCTLVSTVGAISRVRDEERALKMRFKGEWEAWARAVPYKFIPGIY